MSAQMRSVLSELQRLYRDMTGRELPATENVSLDAARALEEAAAAIAKKLEDAAVAPPPLDAWETPREVHVRVDLPGIEPGSLTVENQRGTLFIAARRARAAPESSNAVVLERHVGRIERRLLLPPDCAGSAAHAELKDGVLHVRVERG